MINNKVAITIQILYEEEIKMLIKKKVLSDINIHFNARNKAIKFIKDYGS